ncbi:MMPL family transporter [Halosquirtibacter laminarini]|uniref:MMPL family transporter n=1 Tax=Halosquirtibacter laminarini TaxID=3374600 RepID=A0AC61NI91_9BACT|nr:MMPL family transporter [Prolixibacteraceae bacterium]
MRINRINKVFRKIGAFQIRYRWLFIIGAVFLSVFGFSGLRHVKIANDREDWFDETDAIEIATKKFEDQFGNNDNVNVLVQADDVFDTEVLKMIKELGETLQDSVPYADDVLSLADMELSIGTEEGMQVLNPFEDEIPKSPQVLDSIRNLILSRQALVGKIVSRDCKETWISLSLQEYPKDWREHTTKDPMFQTGEAAIRVITSDRWKSDKYTLKAVGTPYTETEERDFFSVEMMQRFLSVFIMMVVLLVIFTRSLRGVLIPSITTFLGVIVVFGGMGWFGIGLNQNMMMLPVILGMALSVGYSVHMFNTFTRSYRKCCDRKQASIEAVEETGWPIFFTAVTTIGSVLSFISAGIVTIAWVGYACASFVLVDYIFVIVLIPILMSFGKNKEKSVVASELNGEMKMSKFESIMEDFGHFVIRYSVGIIVGFMLLMLVIFPNIWKVETDMDLFRFLGTKIPYVNRVYEVTQSQLGSYLTYNITVDFDQEDAIKDPVALRKFDALIDSVSAFRLTKKNQDAASIFSVLDIIKEMNQTLHGDDPAYYRIPDDKEMVAQILLLYEMSGGTKTFHWIDEDYSMLRAQVQLEKYEANEITHELEAIERIGQKSFSDAKVNYVGSAIQFAELNKKIVSGELYSVIWALIIIGFLLMIVFGSPRTGFIGLIPNFIPLIVIGGVMGYFHSALDMMTMTILPMLLGIAVDDTIHFINAIKTEFENCGKYKESIIAAFHTVGKNIIMTTVILCVSFAMFTLSPVANMVRIGYLAPLGLGSALLADFFVTPAFIYVTKPFGKGQL